MAAKMLGLSLLTLGVCSLASQCGEECSTGAGASVQAASLLQTKALRDTVAVEAPAGYAQFDGDCAGNEIGDKYTASLDTCAEDCSQDSGCSGFSFNSAKGSCRLKSDTCSDPTINGWTFYEREGASNAPLTGSPSPATAATWDEEEEGVVCRLNKDDTTADGQGNAAVTKKDASLAECKAHCEGLGDQCKGIEFMGVGGKCETWSEEIGCILRDPSQYAKHWCLRKHGESGGKKPPLCE